MTPGTHRQTPGERRRWRVRVVLRTGAMLALLLAAGLGASRTMIGTAEAAPDFQLTVAPSAQTLPPGGSVSFAVGIGSVDGFAKPVSLSVDGLPAGVTGTFDPNPVVAPGTSLLNLPPQPTPTPGPSLSWLPAWAAVSRTPRRVRQPLTSASFHSASARSKVS